MKFINEGNIYRLTAKSQMPKADEFESWIFDDVIPSVIKTGNYSIQPQHNIPQTYSDALLLAANQARQIENLKEENHLLVLVISELYFSENIANSTNSCIFAVLNIIKYHPMRAKLAFIAGIFYACILKY